MIVTNEATVDADAWVAGSIAASGQLDIAGTLHQPPGAGMTGNVSYGSLVEQPVDVPPPCRCGAEAMVPVSELEAAHASPNNDNALIGLESDALLNPSDPIQLTLPCGRYYLDAVLTSQPMTILVTGRAALFVGGSITSSAKLQIAVAPSGELDLFVGGTIIGSDTLTLGSPNYPALMRVYIGSPTGLTLSGAANVGAYVWAGYGPVSLSNALEVFGGIFAKSFTATHVAKIHYDRAVTNAGADCPDTAPGDECQSCEDCGNQACIDGQCGGCTASDQCCPPLICIEGTCLTLGVIIE